MTEPAGICSKIIISLINNNSFIKTHLWGRSWVGTAATSVERKWNELTMTNFKKYDNKR